MRILVLNAHPDQGSFSDAVAAAYVEGAGERGHEVKSVMLRELQFDLVLRGGYHSNKPLEPDIAQQQELISWCQHLVVISPNWWWAAPALLKGYVDRVFLPEFAMRYHARFPYVEPLLRGRSARVIYTQNSPRLVGWLFRGDLFWRWISHAVLGHCGFHPVRRLAMYSAKDASAACKSHFLDSARKLGRGGA
ncbi:NAD(P)H-dependent oxidoreductase [Bradyrhizobium sediminis]|uniref:NAD(P)H-dependent oxidoreductase n=1 Tax=Bradyrhizobium sediminis TaxID=2840469 RepID=A0A975RLR4_9BRAD|nr:NAD(P)H-dependent oxidoreductase [Bradyrhizobium sediminis]QWG11984.1 NAD(P)H-dependent oxidoreductase [Bradyrhizobium sediminis]